MKKQVLVVGLGMFGKSLALRLAEKGAQVTVIDKNEDELKEVSSYVTEAINADATDEIALKSLDLKDIDLAIISIGGDIATSVLASLLLKEVCEIKKIIVKGINKRHAEILYKLGVDRVIFPERDIAERLADALMYSNILEVIQLSPDYNFAEIIASKKFVNKTIREIDFRAKYNLTILGIRRKQPYIRDTGETDFKENLIILPSPDEEINEGDTLLVIGREKDIRETETA